jgi:photosynthetic reaction center H subunit
MSTGAITHYIDVAQLTLYAFWVFFAGLIYYLHRENKREGYPLESERSPHVKVQGFPPMPPPKTFLLRDGSSVTVPNPVRDAREVRATPVADHLGAALEPSGPAMLAGVGPGSYAQRADVPDRTLEGLPRIVPLRVAAGFDVAAQDVDPRGLPVLGADRIVGGTVVDVWVDRSEAVFRYLEVQVAGTARTVLLPMNFARVEPRRIQVKSVLGGHFADVPATRLPDQVTLLEEEKIMAYYGAGTLYAEPSRAEPLL